PRSSSFLTRRMEKLSASCALGIDFTGTAHERATERWQEILRQPGPAIDPDRLGALTDFIAKRSAEGGAPPAS
ncbi:MAG: hypothetical protein AAFR50_09550, partial [Pseudomonadota bacterium]